ncbi:tripartite tricarboxylate transporter substrate binding protein [Hydrogenophaga sp. YM1]|uniref:Bug family tripartite tricarboxylate transporter substrate binding protein n=1 Tax=Hydrogenophaga sp. YM1 TaxID=2806262 RepID=UPI00195C8872|nr:tripartite tricarboxylate transporter substrate-binding protein [Hydrogenophaga sp. YM1]QRR34017.1 tripartite tricarboxylate transporter substrate binding protein [Hydrogenophaga sp. YM1]
MTTRRACMAMALLGMTCNFATAQSWPDRPLKIVHGGGPGGNGDLVSRSVATLLGGRLNQSVTVEPRPGAGQSIAMTAVARSTPDGLTLGLLNAGIGVQAALNTKLTYDLRRDFAPVGMVSSFPLAIVVNPASPIKSVRDLLEAARRAPGKLNYGAIAGTTQHLGAEYLASVGEFRWTHVPYPGSTGLISDILGGRLDVVVDTVPSLVGQIRSGKLRALAVTSLKPWPSLPEVSTVAETLAGFEVSSWTGLAVQAATPLAVRERLERELASIVGSEAFIGQVRQLGGEPLSMTSRDMNEYIAREVLRWRELAQKANIVLN